MTDENGLHDNSCIISTVVFSIISMEMRSLCWLDRGSNLTTNWQCKRIYERPITLRESWRNIPPSEPVYIDEDQQENRYIFQYNLMVEINILEIRKRDSVHFYEWHDHQKIYIVNE